VIQHFGRWPFALPLHLHRLTHSDASAHCRYYHLRPTSGDVAISIVEKRGNNKDDLNHFLGDGVVSLW
jgi:hypothetical protein